MAMRFGARTAWALGLFLLAAALPPPVLAGAARDRKAKDEPKPKVEKDWAIQAKSPKHDRDFWYYVPSTVPKRNIALVLSYHGAGGTGKGEIGQWKKPADDNGFIVACPTAEVAGAGHRAGEPMPVRPEMFLQEAEMAISIVDMLKEKFRIDSRRVMVTGFSGGGNPSYWLGFIHSKVFPFLCTRCGNFPMIMTRMCEAQADLKTAADEAAKSSYIYVYWGSRDHPIILGEIGRTLAWIQSLQPARFKQEKVEGMGHESRAPMATAWFVEAMKDAGKAWEAEAKEKYPVAMEAGKAAVEKKDLGEAVRQYLAALAYEEDYKLGKKAAEELKKLESQGRQQLDKVKTMLIMKNPDAEKLLADTVEQFKGTEAGDKAVKMQEDLKAKKDKK